MPFPAKSVNELYVKISKGKYDRIPSNYSDNLSDLINDMLNSDPTKRPTSEAIVACAVLNRLSIPPMLSKPNKRRILQ
jgi:NIMA (never in mitosis gene a)-related kinase